MSAATWCERSGGVLLHLTSLPNRMQDDAARRFLDQIASAGLRVWQFLPIGPSAGERNPFESASAFAGDPSLVSEPAAIDRAAYARFCDENSDWLEDWALFVALKAAHDGAPWWHWPLPLRRRDATALCLARAGLADEIERARVAQFRFETAWDAFHRAAQARGLRLFGDVPLFVSRDSADVWAERELFEVTADGGFEAVVGVPPDAFTDSGQLWGLPPYRWDAMAANGYVWWKRRFEVQARRHDLLRLDHFRGFAAWWRVPASARSAAEGDWTPGPGRAAIDALAPVLAGVQLVAEDLGVITEDVVALRRSLGLAGMRVLQFAFDGDPGNPHLPRHHGPDTVCYTGTHDNDTTLGWWRALSAGQQAEVARVLDGNGLEMPRALVELAWSSPAPLAIVPMQDLLGLDTTARMNRPGIAQGNWRWSFRWDQLPADFSATLRDALARHGRLS
jgi:4-alpha-glucanotransferase